MVIIIVTQNKNYVNCGNANEMNHVTIAVNHNLSNCKIQLLQLTLSEENQKAYKPRPQCNMGSFKSVFITSVKVCDGQLVI